MCTSISITSKNNNVFFGRTMDFSYELDPEVYIVPKNYNRNNNYKFIGTAQNIGDLVFVDGANEEGLGVAALYFPGIAGYKEKEYLRGNKIPVASIDVVKYLLGNCNDVKNTLEELLKIEIFGEEDPITNSVAPLHWIVVDKKGNSITIESTRNGVNVFDNQLKVLSNSPSFDWHMMNLRNYINLSDKQIESKRWNKVVLTPFGQGSGSYGLPGDYTSPSRFVRVAFLKSFSSIPDTDEGTLNLCFNIMKSVNIPKGIVITDRNTSDYTQYTSFMNLNTGDYYFNTYNNNQIFTSNINDNNSSSIISLGKLKRISMFEHI